MTPKEKAMELMGSYRYRLLPFISFQTQLTETDLLNKCKQCALVAVSEIIEEFKLMVPQPYKQQYHYWENVKEEINKL